MKKSTVARKKAKAKQHAEWVAANPERHKEHRATAAKKIAKDRADLARFRLEAIQRARDNLKMKGG